MADETIPAREAASTAHAASPTKKVSNWALLKDRNFRLLWGANSLFFASQQMQLLAMQWLVLSLTGTRTLLGLVAMVQGIAVLLASPLGGVLAERSARRNLLMSGRAGLVLVTVGMGILVITDLAQVWHVIMAALGIGLLLAITQPATQTFLYDIVGKDNLMRAIALNASATSTFNMVGPALGGTLIAVVGVSGAYFAGGSGYLLGILFMAMIPILGQTQGLAKTSYWKDIRDGVKYVRSSPVTLWLMGFVSMNFFAAFVLLFRPIYAKDVLHVGASGLGLMGLFFGLGAMVSSVTTAMLLANVKRKGLLLVLTVMQWNVGMMIFAFSRDFPLTLFSQVLLGMCGPMYQTSIQTILQTTAPDHMRSRVMSLYFMMMQINVFGQFLAGVLADTIGNTMPMVIASLVHIAFLIMVLAVGAPIRDFGKEPKLQPP
jgi:predicted MFS family arabinose efflux permease